MNMGLSNFQKRKIALVFYRYDASKNGVVEAEDLEIYGKEVAKAQGLSEGSDAYNKIMAAYKNAFEVYWAQAANDEGKVTLESYFESCQKFIQFVGVEEGTKVNKSMFDTIDLDNKGSISLNEFKMFVKPMGASDADAEYAFRKLDLNGSGTITGDEFARNLYEYYASDDPDAVGNYFYGTF